MSDALSNTFAWLALALCGSAIMTFALVTGSVMAHNDRDSESCWRGAGYAGLMTLTLGAIFTVMMVVYA